MQALGFLKLLSVQGVCVTDCLPNRNRDVYILVAYSKYFLRNTRALRLGPTRCPAAGGWP